MNANSMYPIFVSRKQLQILKGWHKNTAVKWYKKMLIHYEKYDPSRPIELTREEVADYLKIKLVDLDRKLFPQYRLSFEKTSQI